MTAPTNSSVTLSCELYGYLSNGAEPQISWRKLPNIEIASNDQLYTISSTNGSKQIQNGGSTPGPSLVSSLTIDIVDETVAGTYLCSSVADTIQAIDLTVTTTGRLYTWWTSLICFCMDLVTVTPIGTLYPRIKMLHGLALAVFQVK